MNKNHIISVNTAIFHLEKPIKRISFFNYVFQFYSLNFNGIKIILGKCEKNNLKINKKNLKKIIKIENYFWNKDELENINRFLEKEQISRLEEWILTRSMIKYGIDFIFRDRIKIPFNHIFFDSLKYKKPKLNIESKNFKNEIKKELEEIDISITHSSKIIYVVFTSNQIGVDCEEIQKFSKRLILKFIKKNDYNQLESIFNNVKNISTNLLNTIIWSLKESTLKAKGNKKITDIEKIQFSIDNDNLISFFPQDPDRFINCINVKNNSILTISIKL